MIYYGFIVCQNLETKRTAQLVEQVCSCIEPPSSWELFGNYESEKFPVTKSGDRDDYVSCIDKTFEILKRSRDAASDWVFVGDDDSFVVPKRLEAFCSTLDPNQKIIYGHVVNCVTNHGLIPHAHGGAGVLMSKQTANIISTFIEDARRRYRHTIHSDISLAINVELYNRLLPANDRIKFVHDDRFLSPNLPLDCVDYTNFICLHVKDRISFRDIVDKCQK
jgi:hypothetical protein